MQFAIELSLYHLHTLDHHATLEWLLNHPQQFAELFAYKRLWGLAPERDDLRAQSLAARQMNHARAIAMEKLPAEVQAADLYYLRVQAPPPETPEQEARRLRLLTGR